MKRCSSTYREEGEPLTSMADTRNDIYTSAGSTSSTPCESKESPSNIVTVKVTSSETNGNEEKKDLEPMKSFSSASRPFLSKTDASSRSTQRFKTSFGSKPFILRQSAFGVSKLGSGSSTCLSLSPKPLVLRPSQLNFGGLDSSQTSTALSSESRITNPFARVAPPSDENVNADDDMSEKNSQQNNASPEKSNQDLSSKLNDSGTMSQNTPNSFLASPKFVPLDTSGNQKEDSSSSGSVTNSAPAVSGFVFGQNLYERVEVKKDEETEPSSSETVSEPKPCSSTSTNGTSEMLFSSVIQKELGSDEKSASSSNDSGEKPSKSLSEAAREYEEARAVKRKYEEVTIVTGEEDEVNIIQMNCKLFAFDKPTSTWLERGRGNLRLNDMDGPEGLQSRVVFRTAGSLRVVLNTKIWAGMVVDRASAKSVRLTAMDNTGQIKVFLVMASPKEIESLYHALTSRVARKQQCKSDENRSLSSQQSLEDEEASCSSSSRKRPSLVHDAGGGSEPKI